jgi:S-adenosylmethionine/arginine decarboxylase-like enzyme
MSYWGYHLILDCSRCKPTTIRSSIIITQFAKDLVKKIDMVPYGEPQVVMFGSGNKKGYTLIQLIETSNISAHFIEETNDMYLDVFSCKQFVPKHVKDIVAQYFYPKHINETYLTRQASQFKNGRSIRSEQLQ